MHLQLVKNREEQWAAESQRNPEESDQGLRLFAKGSTERIDFGSAMEWVKLRSLDLSDTGISDLSPLARLTALQSLNLSHTTGIDDLSPLARRPAIP